MQIVAKLIFQSEIFNLQNCFFQLALLWIIRRKDTLVYHIALTFIILFPFFVVAVNQQCRSPFRVFLP